MRDKHLFIAFQLFLPKKTKQTSGKVFGTKFILFYFTFKSKLEGFEFLDE